MRHWGLLFLSCSLHVEKHHLMFQEESFSFYKFTRRFSHWSFDNDVYVVKLYSIEKHAVAKNKKTVAPEKWFWIPCAYKLRTTFNRRLIRDSLAHFKAVFKRRINIFFIITKNKLIHIPYWFFKEPYWLFQCFIFLSRLFAHVVIDRLFFLSFSLSLREYWEHKILYLT